MAFHLGMTLDLCMAYIMHMLASINLTLMSDHSVSAKAKQISFELSATTKQAISIKHLF